MNKAFLKYLAAVLVFGTNGLVASHIPLSSYEIVLLRTTIGGAALLALFFLTGNRITVHRHRRDLLFLLLSAFGMAGNWLFLYEAYQHIGVGAATLCCYCGPVIVMLLSPVFFKEKLTFPKLLGFAVVCLGVVLVNNDALSGGNAWGFLCGMLSALMYALLVIADKKVEHISSMENATLQLVFTAIFVAAFVGLKQGFALPITGEMLPWILLLGLVNTGLGCWCYFTSIGALPVQTVSVCGYLEPLGAVVLGALLLHEPMTPANIIGAVCILGGAMFCELHRRKQ